MSYALQLLVHNVKAQMRGTDMIELTAQDYAAILAAIEPYKFDSGSQINEMLDACYRAGLAAGIERARQACKDCKPMMYGVDAKKKAAYDLGCDECTDAVGALLK